QPPRNYPEPVEADYVIQNFHFQSGETLPELRIHYRTIGTLTRSGSGLANNAVLIGHGTGGSGTQFFNPIFGSVLFGPGQLLDALMPLASNPVEIAGRNRIWRRMAMDTIRDDPDWQGGDYKTQPMRALVSAENLLLLAGSAPLFWQKEAPTREAADKFYKDRVRPAVARLDANDLLYQIDSSR